MAAAVVTQLGIAYVSKYPLSLASWELFNFYADESVPTWAASILWLACGIGLITITTLQSKNPAKKTSPQWYLLAVVSIVLSTDEVARIHEVAGGTTVKLLLGSLEGVLHDGWVIAGMVLVGLVGAVCVPFLWSIELCSESHLAVQESEAI